MKRYDLREYKGNFEVRLLELLQEADKNEILIFLIENQKKEKLKDIISSIKQKGGEIMNSLRFNEVDWTIVAKASNVEI